MGSPWGPATTRYFGHRTSLADGIYPVGRLFSAISVSRRIELWKSMWYLPHKKDGKSLMPFSSAEGDFSSCSNSSIYIRTKRSHARRLLASLPNLYISNALNPAKITGNYSTKDFKCFPALVLLTDLKNRNQFLSLTCESITLPACSLGHLPSR